jgi:ubiquinone/menaquinone biosynthesis C-methylase UbiE
MVAEAQRLNPEIHFHQGNMLSLPDQDNSWGGIAAFYSIIHIPREQIVDALREMKRVLKPVGVLLVTFHIGTKIEHLDEFFEKPVNLDFIHFQPAEMERWLGEAGFDLLEALVREPDPAVEYPSQRAYLFAKKAA